jgi:O-antigen/teichoic acid export membrane protein
VHNRPSGPTAVGVSAVLESSAIIAAEEPRVDIRVADARRDIRALDRTILRGVSWTGGIKGLTLILTWASTIVVARLLTPADFGLVAMAALYLGLTTMITEFGLGNALVALRDLSDEQICQLHTVALLIGLTSFVISCVAAIPLSRFFGAPALAPVVVVLSITLVLDSLRTVPTAVLTKALRFKYLSLLEALKALVAISFTVGLAAGGARYWALVLGNVLAALVLTVFLLVREPLRLARPRFRALKSTLTFSSKLIMGQLAWYGYSNADFLIAGRVLGKVALGEYTLAWTLTSIPGEKIMSVVGRVMPAMFAAVKDDAEALRRYFLLFTEALAILIIPASVGLFLVAHDFVLLVFGVKWFATIVPLQLLCCYASLHLLATPLTPVLQLTGQAGFPVRWAFGALALLPPAFYFSGLRWGTAGIAAMWLVIYPLILLPTYIRTLETLGIGVREYLTCLRPTLGAAAFMAAVVLTVRMLEPTTWWLAVHFGLQVLLGAAAFFAAGYFLHRRRLGVLADFLRAIRSGGKAAGREPDSDRASLPQYS